VRYGLVVLLSTLPGNDCVLSIFFCCHPEGEGAMKKHRQSKLSWSDLYLAEESIRQGSCRGRRTVIDVRSSMGGLLCIARRYSQASFQDTCLTHDRNSDRDNNMLNSM